MDRRLVASVSATVAGFGLLGTLFLAGSLRHPATAATTTHPVEFVAIGAALATLTVGVATTFVLLAGRGDVRDDGRR